VKKEDIGEKNPEIDSDNSSELSDLLEKREDDVIKGPIQARVTAAVNEEDNSIDPTVMTAGGPQPGTPGAPNFYPAPESKPGTAFSDHASAFGGSSHSPMDSKVFMQNKSRGSAKKRDAFL